MEFRPALAIKLWSKVWEISGILSQFFLLTCPFYVFSLLFGITDRMICTLLEVLSLRLDTAD